MNLLRRLSLWRRDPVVPAGARSRAEQSVLEQAMAHARHVADTTALSERFERALGDLERRGAEAADRQATRVEARLERTEQMAAAYSRGLTASLRGRFALLAEEVAASLAQGLRRHGELRGDVSANARHLQALIERMERAEDRLRSLEAGQAAADRGEG